jgi:hypothetical protein
VVGLFVMVPLRSHPDMCAGPLLCDRRLSRNDHRLASLGFRPDIGPAFRPLLFIKGAMTEDGAKGGGREECEPAQHVQYRARVSQALERIRHVERI